MGRGDLGSPRKIGLEMGLDAIELWDDPLDPMLVEISCRNFVIECYCVIGNVL